ncbi:MAG: prepilin-type N-terminal cleavage/methylation domain-containing protein [Lachnospiraceae bacterium]|nr:prepilin-type N-terminal cleavage/methylation domain-containing protein [Lachnospiraceae bacterium]
MKKRFSNNKGFSLVELIIVVAIMAVLIGILAPQYLKYVEKSRLQTDNEYIDSLRKACESVLADPSVDTDATSTITITNTSVTFTDTQDLATEVGKIVDIPAAGSTTKILKSNAYDSASVVINVLADGDGDGTADDPAVEYDASNPMIQ